MKEANALASLKVPLLLTVPPFQNWIALLLSAVLPLQVVVPFRLTMRPPATTLVLTPVIVTLLLKVVLAAPLIAPPVHVASPWNVWSLPASVLPLSTNGGVWVPPFRKTTASPPTLSVLIRNVPAPWVVTLFNVLVPSTKSSVAPAAMLKTPVLVPPPLGRNVPAFRLTVPVLLNAAPLSTVVIVLAVLL